jgi:hypothetical protein
MYGSLVTRHVSTGAGMMKRTSTLFVFNLYPIVPGAVFKTEGVIISTYVVVLRPASAHPPLRLICLMAFSFFSPLYRTHLCTGCDAASKITTCYFVSEPLSLPVPG